MSERIKSRLEEMGILDTILDKIERLLLGKSCHRLTSVNDSTIGQQTIDMNWNPNYLEGRNMQADCGHEVDGVERDFKVLTSPDGSHMICDECWQSSRIVADPLDFLNGTRHTISEPVKGKGNGDG